MAILFNAGRFKATDLSNAPIPGAFLSFYAVLTSTPQPIYADPALSIALTNPVQSDGNGLFPEIWLDESLKPYKVIFSYPDVNNPSIAGAVIWTIAQYTALGGQQILALLNPTTVAETAAGIVPTNFSYPAGDLRRYGGVGDGVADDSAPWATAVLLGVVRIPKGFSFQIVTPATRTGAITILGEGKASKLLADSNILTVNNGTGSVIDNFWMENITAPWIITRNPTNWTLPPYATLQQSNTVLGYQPTVNDVDIWAVNTFTASKSGVTLFVTAVNPGSVVQPGAQISGTGVTPGAYIPGQVTGTPGGIGNYLCSNTTDFASTTVTTLALTAQQQNQNVGPAILFTGVATDIEVSRIYGRFVRIELQDAQYSTVRDCDIRGGKGVWGGINIDNDSNNLVIGKGNKAIGNTVRYASFSGIIFLNNDGPLIVGNVAHLCGESGIKSSAPGGGGGGPGIRNVIVGNHADQNFYDGIDSVSNYPSDDSVSSYDNIVGNTAYQNGGDGINIGGKYNNVSDNIVAGNYRFGIWGVCSYTAIKNNYLYDNNVARNASVVEILGGNTNNSIVGNTIFMGVGANSNGIYAPGTNYIANNYTVGGTNFFGNAGAIPSMTFNNVDDTTGLFTDQSFMFYLSNNSGTIQHKVFSDASQAALGWAQRINGASTGFTTTPTGTDSSTAFAAGAKVSTVTTNAVILDVAPQVAANVLMIATIVFNNTGTALIVRPRFLSGSVNGVTRNRLIFEFFNASTGATVALNTTNIPSATFLQVQFYGKLA